jgi:UDP-3-O-[3-hydroxymyristoyl] glucosamine N-acyltransferase
LNDDMAAPATLGTLAIRYHCELRGDPDTPVDHVATLAGAGAGSVSFLANPSYRSQLKVTGATVVILRETDVAACPVAALIPADPYLVFAQVATALHPPPPPRPGVHGRAAVASGCRVPASCEVQAGAVLHEGVVLGERVRVGANAVLGNGVQVGADTSVMACVVIYPGVRMGQRCLIHSGAVLGADGFGMAREGNGSWVKVPQLGGLVIGDDVEIGANTTVDRGAIGDTEIADGVKLDNQIQIGHNVVIGSHTAMAAMTGVSGSTTIGARCMIGGKVGIVGHLTISDDVVILAGAHVLESITRPGLYGGSLPADEARRWRKNSVRFGQLDALARRLRDLENRLSGDTRDDEKSSS